MAWGKSNETLSCVPDDKGVWTCELKRPLKDGSEQMLAHAEFMVDSECNLIPDSLQEYEDGALDTLRKRALKTLKLKCVGKNPPNY